MVAGEVIGGELRRHAAPAKRKARAEHRHLRTGATERTQQVRREGRQSQAEERERDDELLGGVARAARRRAQPGADHAEHDGAHGDVLVTPGVLAQHPLGDQHQHEQTRRERGLHHGERREQQRHNLKRPAEDRQPRAEHPARAPDESPHERHAQVLLLRRVLGVHRLQRDP
jgi:hypothetical protein